MPNEYQQMEAISEAIRNLSNFAGEPYTGENDVFLDFGGGSAPIQKQFANEISTDRTFTMQIINADDKQDFRIYPFHRQLGIFAYNNQNAVCGFVRTGNMDGFDPATGAIVVPLAGILTANSLGAETIEDFISYCHENPSRITGMQISATNELNVRNVLSIYKHTPFRGQSKDRQYSLSTFTDENTYRNGIVTFNMDAQLDGRTTMELIINRSKDKDTPNIVTITFFIGASHSPSKALESKSLIAKSNLIAGAGLKPVIKPLVTNLQPPVKKLVLQSNPTGGALM